MRWFRRVLAEFSRDALRLTAFVAWHLRRWRLVALSLEKVAALGGNDRRTLLSLATAYSRTAEWDRALSVLETIQEEAGDVESEALRWYMHAQALYETGCFAECERILEHVGSSAWGDESTRLAEHLRLRARIARLGAFGPAGEADWPGILAAIESWHRRGVEDDVTRFWMGMACLQLGRWREALRAFDRVEEPSALSAPHVMIVHHAWVLYRCGYGARAQELLSGVDVRKWPKAERQKAEEILEAILETG